MKSLLISAPSYGIVLWMMQKRPIPHTLMNHMMSIKRRINYLSNKMNLDLKTSSEVMQLQFTLYTMDILFINSTFQVATFLICLFPKDHVQLCFFGVQGWDSLQMFIWWLKVVFYFCSHWRKTGSPMARFTFSMKIYCRNILSAYARKCLMQTSVL